MLADFTSINKALSNDPVYLAPKSMWPTIDVWEVLHEDENGWMKLALSSNGLVLKSSEDGKNISLFRNSDPCQGRKPCLR